FGMEDSESDKLQSAIDKFDSKLKVLDEKKSKYLQMGFKADSKEIKAIDSEIKTTTGQKEKTSQVLSGVQNYDSKLKELENQKKLIQSAMDSAGKEGKAGEVEALKKRLAETSNSIYALNKNEFIREAQISSIKEGVKEIKNTTDSVKSLNKVVSEVDFTKLNPEQMVSKNNAVMKKMQEQAFYSGKGFVNQMNTGIEHQTAINGGNGALKLAGAMDKPIPHSDAKEGPLSRLTESGRAFVTTFEKGIENALGQSTIMNEFGQKFNPMKPIERDSSINSNIISEGITNNNSNSAKTISLNIGSLIQNAEFRGDKSGMEQIAEILLRLINADVEKYEYA
ncbi:MAG: hypothetical protein KDK45_14580, partial [Leptospiraceae bacterium]|nr:hypothetical protein [Leptospiraceae bacterium]